MSDVPTVIVVGGPAGTGKSTIGQLLASQYHCPFIEGDELHPLSNVEKMSRGVPLTDDDRWGWLAQVALNLASVATDSLNGTHLCVILCSMLKRIYRDYLKEKGCTQNPVRFRFIFLYLTLVELQKRVNERAGHFMKGEMVKLQYDIMQLPQGLELVINGGDSFLIDTTGKSPNDITTALVSELFAC